MRLMMEKRYAEACEAFAASDRVGPSIAAKMKLADCEEKRGRLATAWATFNLPRCSTFIANGDAGRPSPLCGHLADSA